MIPKPSELLQLDKRLSSSREDIYHAMLRRVLLDHAHHEFVKPMLGFMRSKRYDLLWKHADSLSAQTYPDASVHLLANQLSLLIKKYPWQSALVRLDPERKALDTFRAAEARCARLNVKFGLLSSLRNPQELLLSRARDWIRYVIGAVPDIDSCLDLCDFGPGASLGVHGDATSFGRKITAPALTVTPGALPYAVAALGRHYQLSKRWLTTPTLLAEAVRSPGPWIRHLPMAKFHAQICVVQNNKVSFVPKTAKTHRAIAVEPLLNSFLQKGVDQYLRSRLLRIGLDLRDQSKNCEMARLGSLDSSEKGFCTIDLSSASDSISIGLVHYLLPPEWFDFLNRLRSPCYADPDGNVVRYHKFCSMGNGFCFPLQSLIFASLAFASGAGICNTDFRVYGDDIIVRKEVFEATVTALKFCGFKLNREKSFSIGPFRESCGADWYNGVDVRPFTLDFRLDSLSNLFKFLNLARRSHLTSMALSEGISSILAEIPDKFQFWRPYPGNPDSGIDPLDYNPRYSRNARWKASYNCYEWLELSVRPVEDRIWVPPWGVMASALRGHESSMLYTFRRRTRTTMRFTAHSGSRSTWLPA